MTSSEPPNVRYALPGFAPGVRDAVYEHVYRDPANELGGILVGDRRDDGVMIVGAIRADGASGDITSLTFTHDSWAVMLAELDARYPGADIVGWYHSHPGHGIFLSGHDRFIHEHFFSAAWQVAIVVDPQRHEEGLFMWQGKELNQVAGAPVDPRWSAAVTPAAATAAAPTSPPPAFEREPEPTTPPPAAPPESESDAAAERAQRRERTTRRPLPYPVLIAGGLLAGAALRLLT